MNITWWVIISQLSNRCLSAFQFNADRGEVDFAYRLGKIFYQGSIYASFGGIAAGAEGVGAIPRNYKLAKYYFLSIARQTWPTDQPNKPAKQKETEKKDTSYAAASAGYLGRMYLRGEGVKADPVLAKMWFERGAEYGDREAQNGLGIIYRDGLLDGRPDPRKALPYFEAAANQELPEALVNCGKYHYCEYPKNIVVPH